MSTLVEVARPMKIYHYSVHIQRLKIETRLMLLNVAYYRGQNIINERCFSYKVFGMVVLPFANGDGLLQCRYLKNCQPGAAMKN